MTSQQACQQCEQCQMKDLDLFASLTEEEKMMVNRLSKPRWYQKGESLFMQGEQLNKLFLMRTGSVRLFKYSEEGKQVTVDVCSQNDLIGEMNLFSESPQVFNAAALEPSLICECQREDFLKLLEVPQVSYKLIQSLIFKLSNNMDEIYSVFVEDVKARVVKKLQYIAEHNGSEEQGYRRLNVRLTHEEIASLANVSRVMVTRIINQLRDEGMLKLDNRYLLLKSAAL